MTGRGRDYLGAVILTAALSTVFNVRIMIALAFSMSIMAIISLLILLLGSRRNSILIDEGSRLRGFKLDVFELPIRAKPLTARWLQLRVLSIETMDTTEGAVHVGEDGTIRLSFRPRYAGRFEGIKMMLEFTDPLRLLSRTVELSYRNPVVEVIPLSLATRSARVVPRMTLTGDSPAGSPGQGQELYGIDAYRGSGQSKDILWRRVARSPNQDLFVKIRESNVPETIRISIIQTVDRGPSRYAWIDLACEALGLVSNHLLAMGLTLKISFSSGGIYTESISAPDELVNCMMDFSNSRPESDNVRWLVQDADLVISGLKELESPDLAQLISRRPSLLTLEDAQPVFLAAHAVIFSGRENVIPLIQRLIEK